MYIMCKYPQQLRVSAGRAHSQLQLTWQLFMICSIDIVRFVFVSRVFCCFALLCDSLALHSAQFDNRQ